MPVKDNPAGGYEWSLTDEELKTVRSWTPPDPWGERTVVASGFVMFDNAKGIGGFREAAIGPTDDGVVRAYVATENPDGTYDTDHRYEGEFSEAFRLLKRWLSLED